MKENGGVKEDAAEILEEIAWIHMRMRKYEKAAWYYEKAMAADEKMKDHLLTEAAKAYYYNGNKIKAKKALKQAELTFPHATDVYCQIGEFYLIEKADLKKAYKFYYEACGEEGKERYFPAGHHSHAPQTVCEKTVGQGSGNCGPAQLPEPFPESHAAERGNYEVSARAGAGLCALLPGRDLRHKRNDFQIRRRKNGRKDSVRGVPHLPRRGHDHARGRLECPGGMLRLQRPHHLYGVH